MIGDNQPAIQPNNWFANSIGVIISCFLCWATGYLMWKVLNSTVDLSDKVINIAVYILGFLTAKLSTIVDWAFSGTSTTKRQGEIIATQATTIASQTVPQTAPKTVTTVTPTNTTTTTTSVPPPFPPKPLV